MFLELGARAYSYLYTYISTVFYMQGTAWNLWSGHIIKVDFCCVGVIVCYCMKNNQYAQHANARGEIVKNRCTDTESESNLESMYLAT